jgi:hypothetical protein
MQLRSLFPTAALVALGGMGGAAAFAARPAPETPDTRAADARAFLEWEAGTWDCTITLVDPASGTSQRFDGVQTDRLGACGLWLITDLRLVADGAPAPPYEGHGVLGWDPHEEKLVGLWVDSKTDWLATAEGGVSGDVLTLDVQARDPATRAPFVLRYVTTRVDEDRRRLEVLAPTPAGGRVAIARIDSTRSGPPPASH